MRWLNGLTKQSNGENDNQAAKGHVDPTHSRSNLQTVRNPTQKPICRSSSDVSLHANESARTVTSDSTANALCPAAGCGNSMAAHAKYMDRPGSRISRAYRLARLSAPFK